MRSVHVELSSGDFLSVMQVQENHKDSCIWRQHLIWTSDSDPESAWAEVSKISTAFMKFIKKNFEVKVI